MSTSPQSDSKRSAGIFVALVPWVAFTLLANHGTLKLGSLVALVIAALIAAPGVLAGRPKLLELGALVTFAGFAVAAFAVDAETAHTIARYARGIAAGALSVICFGSLLATPFTEQYARESVPREFWGSAPFEEANRRLTAMWGAVFAALVPFHIIAGAVDTTRANLIFNWALPIALVVWAVKRSTAEKTEAAVSDA
jgi:hypothetical protein